MRQLDEPTPGPDPHALGLLTSAAIRTEPRPLAHKSGIRRTVSWLPSATLTNRSPTRTT